MLGKRSLAATLKLMVDIAYYLVLFFGVVIVLVVAGVGLFTDWRLTTDVPVRFELDRQAYSITSPDFGGENAEIVNAKGRLRMPSRHLGTLLEQMAMIAAALGITLLIIRRLSAILGSLKAGTPFVRANVSRIRSMGFLIIGLELLGSAMAVYWALRITPRVSAANLHFQADPELSGLTIMTGLILIVLAEVFRIGAEMKGDLEAARTIQFQLVPPPSFLQNKIQIHCHMQPANTVGGDYYDIIPLGDGRVGIVVADVSGKGMPAALLETMLQGSLRTLISAGFRGETLLDKMNQYLVANTPENKMITLFFGDLNTATGDLSYISAGHNPAMIIKADATVQMLESNSLVLGLLPDAVFVTDHTRLDAGDRLLIYTDGIVEASNKQGEEFGEDRLRDLAVSRSELSAPKFQEELYASVLAYCQPDGPADDMTLMVVDRPVL